MEPNTLCAHRTISYHYRSVSGIGASAETEITFKNDESNQTTGRRTSTQAQVESEERERSAIKSTEYKNLVTGLERESTSAFSADAHARRAASVALESAEAS